MKIIAVFKTHFDIGFTKLSREVVQQYSTKMLEDVIKTCEETQKLGEGRQYVWTMSSWPLKVTLENADAENRKRAIKLINNGQLRTHGLPFTTHTEFLTQDELDYGCKIAKNLCNEYNMPYPVSAKMTDVPGHAMGLIEVLCKNGIKFLHLGCNPASTPPDVPLLFWWQDKKGNKVLTMYNKTYGSTVNPPKDWKFPVYLAMQQTNDNIGPQGIDIIELLEKQVDKGSDFVVGTMDDFYNEISKCDLSSLPIVKKDLGDTWIQGVGTYPAEVSKIRRARRLVKLCKNVVSQKNEDISELLEKYYSNVLMFGEHTWGLDVKTHLGWNRLYDKAGFLSQCNEPRYQYIEESWNEQRQRAENAWQAALELGKKLNVVPIKKENCESSPYKVQLHNECPRIILPSGKTLDIDYTYGLIATEQIHKFMKSYLSRIYVWAVADFGRENYPETEERHFCGKLVKTQHTNEGMTFYYECENQSFAEYGNCRKYSIIIQPLHDSIKVKLELIDKQASPMVEYGNMIYNLCGSGSEYRVNKCGVELNAAKDIAKDANSILFCAEDYAGIDDVVIETLDAPLVSFGKNAIYESNICEFTKPEKNAFVFNLFNNMWGTNFPQWIKGDLSYEWIITEKSKE